MATLQVKDGGGNTKELAVNGSGSALDPFIPVQASSSTGSQRRRIDRYLDTVGDGDGTKNANGDYSGAQEIFFIQPPAGVVYRIARMLVYIEDTGSFDSGGYGNGVALTTGVNVIVRDDSTTLDYLLDSELIKTNTHWGRQCYDIQISSFGTGNEAMNARWTFTKAGQYIRLDGDENERLEVILNDDFTHLVDHKFLVQGYIE